jgi:hypothetical protein
VGGRKRGYHGSKQLQWATPDGRERRKEEEGGKTEVEEKPPDSRQKVRIANPKGGTRVEKRK